MRMAPEKIELIAGFRKIQEPVQQEARYMQSSPGHVMTLVGLAGSFLQNLANPLH